MRTLKDLYISAEMQKENENRIKIFTEIKKRFDKAGFDSLSQKKEKEYFFVNREYDIKARVFFEYESHCETVTIYHDNNSYSQKVSSLEKSVDDRINVIQSLAEQLVTRAFMVAR